VSDWLELPELPDWPELLAPLPDWPELPELPELLEPLPDWPDELPDCPEL